MQSEKSANTCSAMIVDLPHTNVVHNRNMQADSNDIGSVSYLIDVNVLFTFSGTSTLIRCARSRALIVSMTYPLFKQ